MIAKDGDRPKRGQTLVLFALVLVALIAIAALAIDVTNLYASMRFYRATADAASLAGAQDLQGTTRSVTTGDQKNARTDALANLVQQLGATGSSGCDPANQINDCQLDNSTFLVSVKTPAPTCVAGGCTADANHSIQVTVRQPSFGLTFARVLGFNSYNVAITSVAGIVFSSKYALVTLQPPNPKNNGTDANLNKDLIVNGNGTILNIIEGDVGTNTSATTTNQGCIKLAENYNLWHHDDLTGTIPGWLPDACVTPPPAGSWMPTLALDPDYMYPFDATSGTTAPLFSTQALGATPCTGELPTDYTTLLPTATTTCYLPGKYTDNQPFSVPQNTAAYLTPGAYYFPSGMSVSGTLAGGLITGQEGVVLQFDESNTKILNGNNAQNIVLNAGGSGCGGNTCRATPAVDFDGREVKTPQGFLLTIEVTRDPNCFSGTTPILCSTDVNQNATVNIAGNGLLTVAGVIYGPSDNMVVHAQNSLQTGLVGQIISYTVTYTGGATVNQQYPGGEEIGNVRLDAACTAPSTPCVP